jgi:hypothetical protein
MKGVLTPFDVGKPVKILSVVHHKDDWPLQI